uniref:Uncharacterized protein n=1 Tax=Romanomermis culicivorax TaxID=13658 RepID=A0A915HG45_ROMCU
MRKTRQKNSRTPREFPLLSCFTVETNKSGYESALKSPAATFKISPFVVKSLLYEGSSMNFERSNLQNVKTNIIEKYK